MKDKIVYIIIAALAVGVLVALQPSGNPLGSIQAGQEYNVEHITSADANSTSTLKTKSGAIGSIVVSEVTGSDIALYATTSQATSTDDLLFTFDSAAVEGTYQYDVNFNHGLLIDVATGFTGDAVITWR